MSKERKETEVYLDHKVLLAARATAVSEDLLVHSVPLVPPVCLVLKVPKEPRVHLVLLDPKETLVQWVLLVLLAPQVR